MTLPTKPHHKPFWNPYRWVPSSREPVRRAAPLYHHRWQGAAGRLHCTLEALTPLLINYGTGQFLRGGRSGKPFLPGTSLKGVIRSLAELIGNAAQPFPGGKVDAGHALSQAAAGEGPALQLDPVARTFGYLNSGAAVTNRKVESATAQCSCAYRSQQTPDRRGAHRNIQRKPEDFDDIRNWRELCYSFGEGVARPIRAPGRLVEDVGFRPRIWAGMISPGFRPRFGPPRTPSRTSSPKE